MEDKRELNRRCTQCKQVEVCTLKKMRWKMDASVRTIKMITARHLANSAIRNTHVWIRKEG